MDPERIAEQISRGIEQLSSKDITTQIDLLPSKIKIVAL